LPIWRHVASQCRTTRGSGVPMTTRSCTSTRKRAAWQDVPQQELAHVRQLIHERGRLRRRSQDLLLYLHEGGPWWQRWGGRCAACGSNLRASSQRCPEHAQLQAGVHWHSTAPWLLLHSYYHSWRVAQAPDHMNPAFGTVHEARGAHVGRRLPSCRQGTHGSEYSVCLKAGAAALCPVILLLWR